jgi:hypothetical protein
VLCAGKSVPGIEPSSFDGQGRTRILWIDAVCINQQDLGKRNHQVMQMGLIYTMSERIIVWLGPSSPKASVAMK